MYKIDRIPDSHATEIRLKYFHDSSRYNLLNLQRKTGESPRLSYLSISSTKRNNDEPTEFLWWKKKISDSYLVFLLFITRMYIECRLLICVINMAVVHRQFTCVDLRSTILKSYLRYWSSCTCYRWYPARSRADRYLLRTYTTKSGFNVNCCHKTSCFGFRTPIESVVIKKTGSLLFLFPFRGFLDQRMALPQTVKILYNIEYGILL